jgi:hypothetical protein
MKFAFIPFPLLIAITSSLRYHFPKDQFHVEMSTDKSLNPKHLPHIKFNEKRPAPHREPAFSRFMSER